MAGLTSGPSGDETRDALAAVLEDQAERKQRQESVRAKPKDRSQIASKLAVPLVVITVWFVFAPPAVLRPPPPAAPTVEDVANGLHMDIYIVATQVVRYRNTNGRLPSTLVEALPGPGAAAGLTYIRSPDGIFEIQGDRDGQVVVYRSTESLTQFVAKSRSAIRRESGS